MTPFWPQVQQSLVTHKTLCLVHVIGLEGSGPREIGARMIVHPDGTFHGTIGGGTLEWQALAEAAKTLRKDGTGWTTRTLTLGPDLGQCCGGRVRLGFEQLDESAIGLAAVLATREREGRFATFGRVMDGRMVREIASTAPARLGLLPDGRLAESFGDQRRTLVLCGAGHVGRALVLTLAPLPFHVMWIDSRPDAFPRYTPGNVSLHRPVDPVELLDDVAERGGDPFLIAMTHSHTLDLALADKALRLGAFPYVGVIGSATKKARFRSRLATMGHCNDSLQRFVCPIGAGGARSKRPEIIAIGIAHELLMRDEALATGVTQGDRDERDRASSAA